MLFSTNLLNILTTSSYKGIGKSWIVNNTKKHKNYESLIHALNKDSKEQDQITLEDFDKRKKLIENELWKLEEHIDGAVAIGDKDFPKCRGIAKSSEQPIVLFYRGDLNLLSEINKNITVIGLLNPEEEIESIEKVVVSELVKKGATIISGLALGCDSIAHRQTIESHGKTIAILPCPLNKIIPAANKQLADDIVGNNGLLITEYYTKERSRTELYSRYIERNRLQALFSNTVILVASYAKNNEGKDSGSRHAMQFALDYSIPRAVIYDSETDSDKEMYDLNRQIIREHNNITVINKNNMHTSLLKIANQQPAITKNNSQQNSIFDYIQK